MVRYPLNMRKEGLEGSPGSHTISSASASGVYGAVDDTHPGREPVLGMSSITCEPVGRG
jgi:hypothetical protein